MVVISCCAVLKVVLHRRLCLLYVCFTMFYVGVSLPPLLLLVASFLPIAITRSATTLTADWSACIDDRQLSSSKMMSENVCWSTWGARGGGGGYLCVLGVCVLCRVRVGGGGSTFRKQRCPAPPRFVRAEEVGGATKAPGAPGVHVPPPPISSPETLFFFLKDCRSGGDSPHRGPWRRRCAQSSP